MLINMKQKGYSTREIGCGIIFFENNYHSLLRGKVMSLVDIKIGEKVLVKKYSVFRSAIKA